MSTLTSLDELYNLWIALTESVSGYPCWRKGGMQTQPRDPYATVYLEEGGYQVNQVVEDAVLAEPSEAGETMYQQPWGATLFSIKVEFWRNDSSVNVYDVALKFRNSLYLEARMLDVWAKCGLAGSDVDVVDMSQVFRADIEPRAMVKFKFYANAGGPLPTSNIDEIDAAQISVFRDTTDDKVADLTIDKPA